MRILRPFFSEMCTYMHAAIATAHKGIQSGKMELCEKDTKKHSQIHCMVHCTVHTQLIHLTFWPKNATAKLFLLFLLPSISNMVAVLHSNTIYRISFRLYCQLTYKMVYLHNLLATNYEQILTVHAKTGGEFNMQIQRQTKRTTV